MTQCPEIQGVELGQEEDEKEKDQRTAQVPARTAMCAARSRTTTQFLFGQTGTMWEEWRASYKLIYVFSSELVSSPSKEGVMIDADRVLTGIRRPAVRR